MKRYFIVAFIIFSLFNPSVNSQTFINSTFITIPGNNYDIDVINSGSFQPNAALNYLCWVNQSDSNYAIYVKRISPGLSENIQVFSSNKEIVEPKLAFSSNSIDLRIVWQMLVNSHWQILTRELVGDSLTNVIAITDSVSDNITPTISSCHVAWINNGNILYQNLDSLASKPQMLDSINCANPELSWQDSQQNFFILYEKGNAGEKQIYSTTYAFARNTPYWFYEKISNGGNNTMPHFSIDGRTVCYQTFINGLWKAVCVGFGRPDTSYNVSCNCEYPDGFYYPVFSKRMSIFTPSFMVYDSDSLNGNKEIFYRPTMYYFDSTINISNAAGDDYSPRIAFYRPLDTTYIAIFWIHDENGKKDIWMARSFYNPNFGAVNGQDGKLENFVLVQNYPNPFNPATTIKYIIPKSGLVRLKVYDVHGREVATLVNEVQSAGEHSLQFTIGNNRLSSGVYFYQLTEGGYNSIKKMILLK